MRDILGHLFAWIVVALFGLIGFLIYKYSSSFFPIFGVFILIMIIVGGINSLSEEKENKKEKQRKNTEDVKRILEEGKRYDKNPILFYREIIQSEKYRKIFDKKIKAKKYQKILKKPLKRARISMPLYNLAISIRALEPDIQKRTEELLKK
tara:strand:- start:791 stop:1243 length:453 start_codon:yes stop_codon:yes gene_type:complete